MVIAGEFQVPAGLQTTWDFLTDIRRVASCIASFDEVEVVDPQNFALKVRQRVGPFAVNFAVCVRFVEVDPLRRVVASGQGRDSVMGSSFELTNRMELEPVSEAETRVRYETTVKINGRLASAGASLIKTIAQREVARAVEGMRDKIGGAAHEAL